MSPKLKSFVLDYEFQDQDGNEIARTSTEIGVGIEVDREEGSANSPLNAVPISTNVLRGYTRPLEKGVGTPEVFILSTSEANGYFDANTGANGRATNGTWWLRSPGSNTVATNNSRHALVDITGGVMTENAPSTNGIRPAMWVRP